MPQLVRKRPARDEEEEEEEDSESDTSPPPRARTSKATIRASQAQTQPATRRRRPSPQRTDSATSTPAPSTSHADSSTSPTNHQTKLLVRLALATTLTRTPLKRSDINSRCGTTPATFRSVFDDAQLALRDVWGMQLIELPSREKITMKERLAAATQSGRGAGAESSGTKAWVLGSALPEEMREAMAPWLVAGQGGSTPSHVQELEMSYMALTTFLVTLIMLSGGSLSDAKIERHLKRVNAERSTPVDSTEKTIARMCKEGYLLRVKEAGTAGEEPSVEYFVGPRGKVEVGEQGVKGLVRKVYGAESGGQEEMEESQREDLEKRIERSLRVSSARSGQSQMVDGVDGEAVMGGPTRGRGNGAPRRRGRAAREDEDD